MDLVLPDFAELVWAAIGFGLLLLPVVLVAVIAIASSRAQRSRAEEIQSLNERVARLEQAGDGTA